jgi:hypothetical protein
MEFLFMRKFIAVMDPEAELLAVAYIVFHFLKFTVVEADLLSSVTCIAFHFLKLSVGEADFRRQPV